jgi:transposase
MSVTPKAEVNSENWRLRPPERGWRTFRRNAIAKILSDSARICIATRYDKLAANYLAFIKPASISIWLHANESTT